jgi:hypothetical protein
LTRSGLWTRLVLRGVPRHLRDSVHGDLLEQRAGAREALAIALHFQVEPYRDSADRRCALLVLLAAAGLLWIVPMAAQGLLAQATVFDDAFSRAVLRLWQAPTVLAAIACGLFVGRVSLLPRHADAARQHMVLVLAPAAALATPGVLQAVLAAVLLAGAAWMARLNRDAASDHVDAA